VKFCISFPHRIQPPNLYVKKVLDEGLLGEPTLLRVRNAHDGASAGWLPEHFYDPVACGGGAMMDLGAHPMYLSRWLMGAPVSVQSTFHSMTGHQVEDNAVSVIKFESGAIAIAETSLVSPDCPGTLELYGTLGNVIVGGTEGTVRLSSRFPGHETNGHAVIPADQLPKALPAPICQWLDAIRGNGEIHFGLAEGRQLTELMVAAYR
jgi:predicted dehydrogenase